MAAAHHWGIAVVLIVAERPGAGLSTPARDVMLSRASKIVGRGWGFGFHEFLDQTGAFLGPLLVALVVKETQHYARAYALLGIPPGLAILAPARAIRLYPAHCVSFSTDEAPGWRSGEQAWALSNLRCAP
jgi:hypothetical protein